MNDDLTVRHLGGDRFRIESRGHTLTVDQPTEDGGTNTAPTPTELCVASLASCVAGCASTPRGAGGGCEIHESRVLV